MSPNTPWKAQTISTARVTLVTGRADSDGALQCLRFTTSQRDSYFSVPLDQVEPWYQAMKKLLNMLYDDKYIVKRKMNEGESKYRGQDIDMHTDFSRLGVV